MVRTCQRFANGHGNGSMNEESCVGKFRAHRDGREQKHLGRQLPRKPRPVGGELHSREITLKALP